MSVEQGLTSINVPSSNFCSGNNLEMDFDK